MKETVQFAAVCWGIVILFWVVSAFWVKPTKERQSLSGRLGYLGLTVVVVLLFRGAIRSVSLSRSVLPHTLAVGIVADVLILMGLVVSIWARAVLGTNWSSRVTLKVNHQLIEHGPYRVVRHPIYSGLLLMILGTAVLIGRISGFFALAVSFAGLWLKLRQEEKLLTKHFPQYAEYKARTKALVPFVL